MRRTGRTVFSMGSLGPPPFRLMGTVAKTKSNGAPERALPGRCAELGRASSRRVALAPTSLARRDAMVGAPWADRPIFGTQVQPFFCNITTSESRGKSATGGSKAGNGVGGGFPCWATRRRLGTTGSLACVSAAVRYERLGTKKGTRGRKSDTTYVLQPACLLRVLVDQILLFR